MKKSILRLLAKAVLLSATFSLLQACAPAASSNHAEVAGAFQASNTISVKPYTRTIFSSNDF